MNLAKNSDGCSGEMVFQPLTLVSSAKQKEIIFLLFMSNFTSSKQIFSLVFIFFNHFPYHIPNNCLFLCVEKRRMNDRERNVASNFLVFALNKEGVAFKTGCSWHSYSVCHNGATICGLERAKPLSNEGERCELSFFCQKSHFLFVWWYT